MTQLFTGNCPSVVNKDAKYSVRMVDRQYVVGLLYRAADGETWRASTHAHSTLVRRVNDIKTEFGGVPGGAFYINEYRQVIVPAGRNATFKYYFAGKYFEHIFFEFEGKVLSGDAKNLSGEQFHPGEAWVGPHVGIPYVLQPGGPDIRYTAQVRPNVTKDVTLSECANVTPADARALALRLLAVRGEAGRFYINEWRQMFAPAAAGRSASYLGPLLPTDPWFPEPNTPPTTDILT